jgi:hypothetical protein
MSIRAKSPHARKTIMVVQTSTTHFFPPFLAAFFGAALFGAAFLTTFFGAALFGAAFLATFFGAAFFGAALDFLATDLAATLAIHEKL